MGPGTRVVLNAGQFKGKAGYIFAACAEGGWEVSLDDGSSVVAEQGQLIHEAEYCRCPDETWKPGGSMQCTCGAMLAERVRRRAEGLLG